MSSSWLFGFGSHCRSKQICQQRPKALAGSENPRFDGSQRYAHGVGDLLVLEAVHITQHDRFPKIGRERCQGSGDQLPADIFPFKIIHFGMALDHGRRGAFSAVGPDRLLARAPEAMRPCHVDGHSIEPGTKRALTAEVSEKTVRAHEHLLREVVDVLRLFAYKRAYVTIDQGLVAAHERLKGEEVPSLCGRD